MEVSPISFQGAKFARRKQMTPTQKKIQAKLFQATQALYSKKLACCENKLVKNQYMQQQALRCFF